MPKKEGKTSKSILSGGGSVKSRKTSADEKLALERGGVATRTTRSAHVNPPPLPPPLPLQEDSDEVMSSSASDEDDVDDVDNDIGGIATRTRSATSQRLKFKFFPRKGQGPREWIPEDVMIADVTMQNTETGETKIFVAADIYERKKKNGEHDFYWAETRAEGEFIEYLPEDPEADAVRLAERICEAGTNNGLVFKKNEEDDDDDDDYGSGWLETVNGEFLSYARQTSENTFDII